MNSTASTKGGVPDCCAPVRRQRTHFPDKVSPRPRPEPSGGGSCHLHLRIKRIADAVKEDTNSRVGLGTS